MPEGNFPGLTIVNTKRERTLGHIGSKGLPTSGCELKGKKKRLLCQNVEVYFASGGFVDFCIPFCWVYTNIVAFLTLLAC